MNIRNCRECGRIFNYLTGAVLCPVCRDKLEEKFQEVKEDSPMFLSCEMCGAPIRSGRYCEKCKMNMTKGFNEVLKTHKGPEPKQEPHNAGDNARMRFLK